MYGECTWKAVVSKGLTIGTFPAICFTIWIKWGLLWRTKKSHTAGNQSFWRRVGPWKVENYFLSLNVVEKPAWGCCLLRPPPTLEHHLLFWKDTLHSRCKLKLSEYFSDFFFTSFVKAKNCGCTFRLDYFTSC